MNCCEAHDNASSGNHLKSAAPARCHGWLDSLEPDFGGKIESCWREREADVVKESLTPRRRNDEDDDHVVVA